MSTNFSKTPQYQIFKKVCSAVLELLHVERPTDGHGEAIHLVFANFCSVCAEDQKNLIIVSSVCHAEGPLSLSLQEAIISSASNITTTSSVTDIAYC